MSTGQTFIDQVLRRLNEDDPDHPVRWSREEILWFTNEILFELNLIAWEFRRTLTSAINSTDNVYATPTGAVGILGARVNNKALVPATVEDIDREAKWDVTTAKRMRVESFAPLGLDHYLIYPRPLAAATAYLECLAEHTEVADDDTDLPIREEYEPALEDAVVERATFKEGGSDLAQAAPLYQSALDAVQELSGRNIIKSYPRFVTGIANDDGLREGVEGGQKG